VILACDEDAMEIFNPDSNSYEHKIKLNLNAKESQDIRLKFNIQLMKQFTKSCTLKRKLIAYSSGNALTTLYLTMNLFHPEVAISSNELNLNANFHPCTYDFHLNNLSNELDASYELYFEENSQYVSHIREKHQRNASHVGDCLMNQKSGLKEIFFANDIDDEDVDDGNEGLNIKNVDNAENVLMLSSTSFINNIHKATSVENISTKDILRYLDFSVNNENSEKYEGNLNAENKICLHISRPTGVLRPNERRLISISFNGSSTREESFFENYYFSNCNIN
jgi:hypothetical protein